MASMSTIPVARANNLTDDTTVIEVKKYSLNYDLRITNRIAIAGKITVTIFNVLICHFEAPSFILPYIYEKPAETNGIFNDVSDKKTKSSVESPMSTNIGESPLVHLTSELGRNLAQEFVQQVHGRD